MAPEQESESTAPPPEKRGRSSGARRGRRSGRGRRGRGTRRTGAQPKEESEAPAEKISPDLESTTEVTEEVARAEIEVEPEFVEEPVADAPMVDPVAVEPEPESEPEPMPAPAPAQSSSPRVPVSPATMQQAIEDVNRIIDSLRESLDDMEEVLEFLELAERQKNADEREIETLRRNLRQLQQPRDRGHQHQNQHPQHRQQPHQHQHGHHH